MKSQFEQVDSLKNKIEELNMKIKKADARIQMAIEKMAIGDYDLAILNLKEIWDL